MLKIQINLRTITQNLLKIKKNIPKHTKICAVVKANAYGLGDIKIARHIEPKVEMFGVATVKEAKRLRNAGIKKDILVFGVTQPEDLPDASNENLIITVGSVQEIENIIKTNAKFRVHIAADTGFNRFGVKNFLQFRNMVNLLLDNKNITTEGLYTHFTFEDNHPELVSAQMKKFEKFINFFKPHFPKAIIHGASSGQLNCPAAVLDMVRVGKALYGGVRGTKTAVKITSKIIAVKNIKAGETVGYNGEWIAASTMTIGIVAGGYADGINMRWTKTMCAIVDDTPCKILGRVCMDCFFIDITHVKSPLNKTVTIISPMKGQTLMDVYQKTNVIVCNILCGISAARAEITYKS
jgi:alanine racemase